MDFLKAILGDELYAQLEQAIAAYNGKPENAQQQVKLANLAGGQYVSKGKYDTLDATNKTNEQKLGEANNLIEQLQNKSTPDFGEYEQKIKALQHQIKQVKIKTAVEAAMISEQVTDRDFILFKLDEMGSLELDENGCVKGLNEKIVRLKNQYKKCFGSSKRTGTFEGVHARCEDMDYGFSKKSILSMPYNQRVALFMNEPATYMSVMHGN